MLAHWAQILATCPASRLRIQSRQLANPGVSAHLRQRLGALGIPLERVTLLAGGDYRNYLAAHAEVDILLDTFPYTGGTTTCEALWMGVPNLTLAGETLLARLA